MAIVVFSFIYTENIANYALQKNPLYQEILSKEDNYNIKSVNAYIDNEYITPGLNGKKVNVKHSFFNMKSFKVFNDYYLVYNEYQPDISINDNKDKIINKGNFKKNSVSFILEYDPNLIDIFRSKNIEFSILVNKNNYNKLEKNEQINNDYKNYNDLETLLNKSKKNTNICYINPLINDICKNINGKILNSRTIFFQQ